MSDSALRRVIEDPQLVRVHNVLSAFADSSGKPVTEKQVKFAVREMTGRTVESADATAIADLVNDAPGTVLMRDRCITGEVVGVVDATGSR